MLSYNNVKNYYLSLYFVPYSDRMKIMHFIYRNRQDWGPASVNFTWGYNGAVQG